jgi:virulence-associated protein VapD
MDLNYMGAKIDFHCRPKEPILDKIRAEIEQVAFKDVNGSKYIFDNRVNQIIDKYKAESER